MSWQDRLLLKMMSSKIVIRIFSNPVVIKGITLEMRVCMCIVSLFKRKKAKL